MSRHSHEPHAPAPAPPSPSPEVEKMKRDNKRSQLKSIASTGVWSGLGATALNAICTGLTCVATIQHHSATSNLSKINVADTNSHEQISKEQNKIRQASGIIIAASAVGVANGAWKCIHGATSATQAKRI